MKGLVKRSLLAISAFAIPAFCFVLPIESLPDVVLTVEDVASSESRAYNATGNTIDDDDTSDPLPVIVWHGLGDSATAQGMQDIAELITEVHPGTYVQIISATTDPSADRQASWFGNVSLQLELVCETLAKDPILSTAPGIDAIGFSQGGQFLRAYQERCGHRGPKIRNLLTFGSQHNGITEFQHCSGPTDFICQGANALLRGNVWSDFVQARVVPAQYYRGNAKDDANYQNYLEHSNFLADINNERDVKNESYARNIAALGKLVMIVFESDKTVVPKESGWFAEVDVESGNVTALQDRPLYKEDWLGLKKLDEKGGLVFESIPGGHMQLNDKDLKRLFGKYLGPEPEDKPEKSTTASITDDFDDYVVVVIEEEEKVVVEEQEVGETLDLDAIFDWGQIQDLARDQIPDQDWDRIWDSELNTDMDMNVEL